MREIAYHVARIHRMRGAAWEHGEALATQVADAHDRLDATIRESAERWRMERLGVIERNILRLGIFELERETAPPAVVIDEAVRLAQRFAGAKAPPFVNGVLDAVARRLGRL